MFVIPTRLSVVPGDDFHDLVLATGLHPDTALAASTRHNTFRDPISMPSF